MGGVGGMDGRRRRRGGEEGKSRAENEDKRIDGKKKIESQAHKHKPLHLLLYIFSAEAD